VSQRTRCALNDPAVLKDQLAYPWMYLWPRPMRNIDNNTGGDVVWGEPCSGVMHFDCVGLINWCLSKLCGNPIQNEIYHYNNTTKDDSTVNQEGGYGWTTRVQGTSDYQPGDILTVGNHHIGMVSFDGIVQAADTPLGVIAGQGYGGGWTHHMRLSDYFWVAQGGVN
jgi:cell wall-associated NlpC family hydrolase